LPQDFRAKALTRMENFMPALWPGWSSFWQVH